MLYDAGEWIPATLMGAPLHHAMHIELVNLPDFEPRLPHDRPSTFVVELLDHEVRQVTTGAESGRGGGFRSTYTATIASICRTVEEQSPRRRAVDERE